MSGHDENSGTLGRIALKKMSVRKDKAQGSKQTGGAGNPMNRLVPYLDLFGRLNNEELSRLSRVPANIVEQLRGQVVEVQRALHRYGDLLSRLSDDELARLTGASPKTIRFWRLSSPRGSEDAKPSRSSIDPEAITRPLSPVGRDELSQAAELPREEVSETGPLPGDSGITGRPLIEDEPDEEQDIELGTLEDDDDLEVTRDDFF